VAVYIRTAEKAREFIEKEIGSQDIRGGYNLREFTSLLRKQSHCDASQQALGGRIWRIFSLISNTAICLSSAGNSHFPDTGREANRWAKKAFYLEWVFRVESMVPVMVPA
jgi:6-phosphogluconate dehydrogenase